MLRGFTLHCFKIYRDTKLSTAGIGTRLSVDVMLRYKVVFREEE
jgi:hypothetical protein